MIIDVIIQRYDQITGKNTCESSILTNTVHSRAGLDLLYNFGKYQGRGPHALGAPRLVTLRLKVAQTKTSRTLFNKLA